MDKYDEQIERLLKSDHFKDDIASAWACGNGLFQFAYRGITSRPLSIGCLTMIKSGNSVAQTPELTEAIRKDERIPLGTDGITPDNLEVFAEWQRRFDKELAEVNE